MALTIQAPSPVYLDFEVLLVTLDDQFTIGFFHCLQSKFFKTFLKKF